MKTIRVSAAVIQSGECIYATRRAKGSFKGSWEFPGGKREEGESGEEAVIREIWEELGAKIKVEKLLCTIEYDYPDFHLIMDSYLARIENGHLTLSEHDEAKWLSLDELDTVAWLPADILVVNEIKAHFAKEI